MVCLCISLYCVGGILVCLPYMSNSLFSGGIWYCFLCPLHFHHVGPTQDLLASYVISLFESAVAEHIAMTQVCVSVRQWWLTNVKYLRLSLNTSWALAFCIDVHVCTSSKVIGKNEEEIICLQKKEYIHGQRCERTTMAAKCQYEML